VPFFPPIFHNGGGGGGETRKGGWLIEEGSVVPFLEGKQPRRNQPTDVTFAMEEEKRLDCKVRVQKGKVSPMIFRKKKKKVGP